MGYPPQGAVIPPEFYENVGSLLESSKRLEKATGELVKCTYVLLAVTLVLGGIAIASFMLGK